LKKTERAIFNLGARHPWGGFVRKGKKRAWDSGRRNCAGKTAGGARNLLKDEGLTRGRGGWRKV